MADAIRNGELGIGKVLSTRKDEKGGMIATVELWGPANLQPPIRYRQPWFWIAFLLLSVALNCYLMFICPISLR